MAVECVCVLLLLLLWDFSWGQTRPSVVVWFDLVSVFGSKPTPNIEHQVAVVVVAWWRQYGRAWWWV